MGDTRLVERYVTCPECGAEEEATMSVVAYGMVEVGEWSCPGCDSLNEYSRDWSWDLADQAFDMGREAS
jgi:rubredoxin